jgi:DNA-binding transcriptional LysR family regulator
MINAQLRSFHAVAREGGYATTAREPKVSQPSVTYQMRQLKTAWAVASFHRRENRIERSRYRSMFNGAPNFGA